MNSRDSWALCPGDGCVSQGCSLASLLSSRCMQPALPGPPGVPLVPACIEGSVALAPSQADAQSRPGCLLFLFHHTACPVSVQPLWHPWPLWAGLLLTRRWLSTAFPPHPMLSLLSCPAALDTCFLPEMFSKGVETLLCISWSSPERKNY